MDYLEMYIPPKAELLRFGPKGDICVGYDDSWVRGADPDASDPYGGIELPDDIWGENSGGGIELPDDKL